MKILPLIAAILTALAASWYFAPQGSSTSTHPETAFERVTRTGTLRCGYIYWDPCIGKNDKGELTGMCVDIANEAAKVGEFKVEWVGPLDWGNIVTEISSHKIDALCVGMWESGIKAKHLAFTAPFAYEGLEAFVRKGDGRFSTESSINNANVKIATIDNDNTDYIARALFPQAQKLPIAPGGSDPELMTSVMTGKADVTFTSLGQYQLFNASNPNKLERAMPNHYLRVLGNTPFVVSADDFKLFNFLQSLMNEISNAGTINRILDKYPYPFIRKATPYQQSPQ